MKIVLKSNMSFTGTKNMCLHISFKIGYTAQISYFIRDIIP